MKPTYHAQVKRDGAFWFIEVPEVKRATQGRTLREVPVMATDLIAIMTDLSPDSFEVVYEVELPGSARVHLDRARELRESEAEARQAAAAEVREAARELRGQGLTVRDIGEALGVSYQRAHQLVTSG